MKPKTAVFEFLVVEFLDTGCTLFGAIASRKNQGQKSRFAYSNFSSVYNFVNSETSAVVQALQFCVCIPAPSISCIVLQIITIVKII